MAAEHTSRRSIKRIARRTVAVVAIAVVSIAGGEWAAGAARADRPPSEQRTGTPIATADAAPVAVSKAPGGVSDGPALVVLWGDSLAWQAKEPFAFAVGHSVNARVEIHAFPGTATCDWLADMEHTIATERVTAAVLEFSGNALTPCMKDTTGAAVAGAAYLAKYTADTVQALTILRDAGVSAVLVGAPPHRGELPESAGAQLRTTYRYLADRTGAAFVDAGAAVLDHGRYTETLPCLLAEGPAQGCHDGQITVRAPDGAHFCPHVVFPADDPAGECAVWSSGAFRFGVAMAAPVVARIRGAAAVTTGVSLAAATDRRVQATSGRPGAEAVPEHVLLDLA